jgi:hypothetical protein
LQTLPEDPSSCSIINEVTPPGSDAIAKEPLDDISSSITDEHLEEGSTWMIKDGLEDSISITINKIEIAAITFFIFISFNLIFYLAYYKTWANFHNHLLSWFTLLALVK